MPEGVDAGYMRRLEDACVATIDRAATGRQPVTLSIGMGPDPDVARNRRHPGGIVDRALPVLRVRRADGTMLAVVVCYACHPVTLGADNLLWTADYPHYVRSTIEAAYPGATALFLTGCTGDANTGHSAHASQVLAPSEARSFVTAERLGRRIGEAALAAPEQQVGESVFAADCTVSLGFERRESEPLNALATGWRAEAAADPGRRVLLAQWARWAETWGGVTDFARWSGRVVLFDWGGVPIVALPGEIFAETGLSIRAAFDDAPAFVVSYAEALPGYIPPRSEYRYGGYEVDEAHRYIGMPATFAPGSAEALAEAAIGLLARRHPRTTAG
jgi:hypothetical protein